MKNEVIEKTIEKYNPWRRGEGMSYLGPPAYRRTVFGEVWDIVAKGQRIPLLSGPFGVGKTTVLLQIVEKLLASGTPPGNITYISLNDPALWQGEISTVLNELISEFKTGSGRCYLLLDDCHRFPDTYEYMTAKTREYPGIGFAATGEPTADNGPKRRIRGKTYEVKIPSFSFSDYFFLDLSLCRGFDKAEVIRTGYQNAKADFYKLFARHFSEHIDGLPILPLIEKGVSELISLLTDRLPVDIPVGDDHSERLLLSYLSAGGLPAMWGIKDPLSAGDYIVRNYIERFILRNTGEISLDNSDKWSRIIYSIFIAAGEETSPRRIAKNSGSGTGDVNRILPLLEESGFITVVRRYKTGKRKAGDNFIVYPFDTALRSALTVSPDRKAADIKARSILAYNVLRAWESLLTINYYRDDNGDMPGFVVALDSGRELPVFFDDGSKVSRVNVLGELIRTGETPYGIMVTGEGNVRFKDRILYLPLNYFLLFFKDI